MKGEVADGDGDGKVGSTARDEMGKLTSGRWEFQGVGLVGRE